MKPGRYFVATTRATNICPSPNVKILCYEEQWQIIKVLNGAQAELLLLLSSEGCGGYAWGGEKGSQKFCHHMWEKKMVESMFDAWGSSVGGGLSDIGRWEGREACWC